MWKLAKLEIRGFKSFADAAALDFPEGITAVVGPNGCGKSNISDAILWVLGEQSTRALRAQRMQDVIFQGTATRRAIGLAEVTLHLSNGQPTGDGHDPLAELEATGTGSLANEGAKRAAGGDGASGNGSSGDGTTPETEGADTDVVVAGGEIAINASGDVEITTSEEPLGSVEVDLCEDPLAGLSELMISRRLYRSGESEYLLNGEKCRLRDVREHLAGTGLGARACFQIGQGEIDQILSASSLERRAPLEEAAGITLYRHRRHLTELKLEATAQDLARIDDIYQEVARQMRSLKRQAGRAGRYKRLRAQIRRLERAWLHGAFSEARQKLDLARAGTAGATEAEESVRESLDGATEKLADARRRLRESRTAEQKRRHNLYKSQLEEERLKAESRRQQDRLAFAEQRLAELRRRSEEIDERLEEASGLQLRRDEVVHEAESAAAAAAEVLDEAERELDAARRRLQGRLREAAPTTDGEPRPLSADLVVEEEDFAALVLTLGGLLDAKLLAGGGIAEWLEEAIGGAGSARVLRRAEGSIAAPPPADDRIVGALRDRVSGRTEVADAVIKQLLHDSWLVRDALDAPSLAADHPGHAFVDVSGSCWASGVEVRACGRQAHLRTLEAEERASASRQDDAAATSDPEVTSPEELAARDKRDRTATAKRAADAQAQAARQELAVLQAALRRLHAERERTSAEVGSLKEASDEARQKAEEARREARAAGKRSSELEVELEGSATDDKAAEAAVAGVEAAQAEARAKVEKVQRVRSQWEVEAAEARVGCEHLEQQIRERLTMEADTLLEEGPVAPDEEEAEPETKSRRSKDDLVDVEALDARSLRALIQEVQGKIDRLGPVNLVAYEDFEVQEKRYDELGTQRKDLKAAAENLAEAIRRIDGDCVERFGDAFDSINGYFNRIFRQLFGGGKAGMRLEDPQDPLNSGIEIYAQPPGKKLQNIRLLSGGERTLVALSVLFAIFEYRPAAFCILDEADAALDEPNIDRFLRALHSFEHRTQFILITHNKRTMEIADLLYGVTMEESGVSQLVSVQLH